MEIGSKINPVADQVLEKKDDIKNRQAEMERKKLKKACADFESLFVYYMFKTMRQTVPQSGFLGRVPGKDTYEMMLDQKMADEVATQRGGIGLQKALLDQMDRSKIESKRNLKEIKK